MWASPPTILVRQRKVQKSWVKWNKIWRVWWLMNTLNQSHHFTFQALFCCSCALAPGLCFALVDKKPSDSETSILSSTSKPYFWRKNTTSSLCAASLEWTSHLFVPLLLPVQACTLCFGTEIHTDEFQGQGNTKLSDPAAWAGFCAVTKIGPYKCLAWILDILSRGWFCGKTIEGLKWGILWGMDMLIW